MFMIRRCGLDHREDISFVIGNVGMSQLIGDCWVHNGILLGVKMNNVLLAIKMYGQHTLFFRY